MPGLVNVSNDSLTLKDPQVSEGSAGEDPFFELQLANLAKESCAPEVLGGAGGYSAADPL